MARDRALVRQLKSGLQHRKAALRQDRAVSLGGKVMDKEVQEAGKEIEADSQERGREEQGPSRLKASKSFDQQGPPGAGEGGARAAGVKNI